MQQPMKGLAYLVIIFGDDHWWMLFVLSEHEVNPPTTAPVCGEYVDPDYGSRISGNRCTPEVIPIAS